MTLAQFPDRRRVRHPSPPAAAPAAALLIIDRDGTVRAPTQAESVNARRRRHAMLREGCE